MRHVFFLPQLRGQPGLSTSVISSLARRKKLVNALPLQILLFKLVLKSIGAGMERIRLRSAH